MEGRNLWITIGPQCCGKTTFLRDRNVTDVSMDAMPETYYPYLVDEVIKYSQGDLSEDDWHKYERDIYGLTISSRIDQLGESECLALILFFHEVISIDQLAWQLKFDFHFDETEAEIILDVVGLLFSQNYCMTTRTIDFFLSERRFESIHAAQSMLWSICNQDGDIAWGNTNLRSQFYQVALDVAYQSHRKVKFIKWGHELPYVDLSELYRRNIIRFLSTGRFIPFSILQRYFNDANKLLAHWENLVETAEDTISLDELLIQEAGYSLRNGFLV